MTNLDVSLLTLLEERGGSMVSTDIRGRVEQSMIRLVAANYVHTYPGATGRNTIYALTDAGRRMVIAANPTTTRR